METQIRGFKKCPKWLREAYIRGARYKCQQCKKHQEEVGKLTPHRIKRGNEGGLYTVYTFNHKLNNIKVLCKKCHKKVHSGEFGHISHSY